MYERDAKLTKIKYIQKTYELISSKGFENLTIRAIAKEVGCSYAVLYKHFENLDYLIMLASMRFLDGYHHEMVEIEKNESNYLLRDLKLWFAFNKQAFKNPPVFLHLFWENLSTMFEEAAVEYCQLFPLERGGNDEVFYGYLYSAVFMGGIEHRDFILLRRAANEGSISLKDAVFLSKVNHNIVQGQLRKHLVDYKESGRAELATMECNELLQRAFGLVCRDESLTL